MKRSGASFLSFIEHLIPDQISGRAIRYKHQDYCLAIADDQMSKFRLRVPPGSD